MLLPNKKNIIHKTWLLRLLGAIYSHIELAPVLKFKGGTCAALRGLIDRFSIDLDFDLLAEKKQIPALEKILEKIFQDLDLTISDQSQKVPQYFLKYPAQTGERNSIKIDITFPPPKANNYEAVYINDLDRIIPCEDIPTMVANKMVAPLDRFQKHQSIAGRDFFDIHAYLLKGLTYNQAVIAERYGKNLPDFFENLISFIKKHLTQTIIDQDLNHLLPQENFKKIRLILKQELLMLLENEARAIN